MMNLPNSTRQAILTSGFGSLRNEIFCSKARSDPDGFVIELDFPAVGTS